MQALVVVDAQNEFSADGLRAVPNHAEALACIQARVEEARRNGSPIAWVRHYNKPNESRAFVPGSWGAELSGGLEPYPVFAAKGYLKKTSTEHLQERVWRNGCVTSAPPVCCSLAFIPICAFRRPRVKPWSVVSMWSWIQTGREHAIWITRYSVARARTKYAAVRYFTLPTGRDHRAKKRHGTKDPC